MLVSPAAAVEMSAGSSMGVSAAGSAGAGAASAGGTGFATTYGFTTTHGFSLPLAGSKPKQQQQEDDSERALKKQQQQQQPAEECGGGGGGAGGALEAPLQRGGSGLAGKHADSVRSCSTLSSNSTLTAAGALAVRVPSTDNTLGWRGMLEASKAVVGSGVLGGLPSGELAGGMARVDLCCTAHTTPGVRRLVKSVVRGLKACQDPEPSREGMGGSYFCLNEAARKVAIFKPCDEEPLAPNNPKGYVGRNLGDPGWKPTVRVGEAALREVAAYLLDHAHFARVPHTTLVRASHPVFHYAQRQHLVDAPAPCTAGSACDACGDDGGSSGDGGAAAAPAAAAPAAAADPPGWLPPKLGSLQEFVVHLADTSELGSGRLAKRDVHRIGILDVRLFNTDRHAGNILVCSPGSRAAADSGADAPSRLRAGSGVGAGLGPGGVAAPYELVPIDHGFCLPDSLEAPYFEWLHWPQAMLPFEQEELDYIAGLDAAADVALLRSELPALRPQCLRVLQVGTVFLQRCAAAGLSLAAIGNLMSRPLDALDGDDSNPSELERACVAARMAVDTAVLMGRSGSIDSASVAGLTLAEADEEEEGEGSDSGVSSDGEAGCCSVGGAAGAGAAGGASPGAGRGPSRLGRGGPEAALGSGRNSGDGAAGGLGGLLFELEGEGEGDGSIGSSDAPARCGSSDAAALQSPNSALSVDSLGSAGGGRPCHGLPAAGAPGRNASEGGDGALGVARSVYGGGFMWRPPKPVAGRMRTQSPRRVLGARPAYPPPVVVAPPRPTAEVLAGLSEEQFGAFVTQLVAIMDDALRSGAWSAAAAAPMAVAMSCPRF